MKRIAAFLIALLAAQIAHAQVSGTMTITGPGAGSFSWLNPVSGCTASGTPATTLTCNGATGTPLATLNESDLGVAASATLTWTPANAPPAWVQGATSGDFSGATHISFVDKIPATTATGPFAVCGVATWGGTSATVLTSLVDNNGVKETLGTPVVDTVNQQVMAMFWSVGLPAAPTSITENFSSAVAWNGVGASVYTGVATASPTDGAAQQLQMTPGTAANAVQSGAITTTAPDVLCAGTMATGNAPSSLAAGTGFKARGNSGNQLMLEDLVQTAAGMANGTFTIGSSQAMATGIVALKP